MGARSALCYDRCVLHRFLSVVALLLLLVSFGTGKAAAQQCPRSNEAGISSRVERLGGRLIYHDGIRQWFELKLDTPTCGAGSIQLVQFQRSSNALERLRGCRVESTGPLGFAFTGYYSRDLYQDVRRLKPRGICPRKPLLPDYSHDRPDPNVHSYIVSMHVDYRPGDHPILFRVRSGGRELHPWQAYAGYLLTGGFVLYGSCAPGFMVDQVYGTSAARPGHFTERQSPDDQAEFDPESAAKSGTTDLHLGYTCIRRH